MPIPTPMPVAIVLRVWPFLLLALVGTTGAFDQACARPLAHPIAHPSARPFDYASTLPFARPFDHPSALASDHPIARPPAHASTHASARPFDPDSANPFTCPFGPESAHPFAHPFAHKFAHPFARPFDHESAHPFARPFDHKFAYPFTRPFDHECAHPSALASDNPIARPFTHPSALASDHPIGHPSAHPSTHASACPFGPESAHTFAHPFAHKFAHSIAHPYARHLAHPIAHPSAHPFTRPFDHESTHPSARPLACAHSTPDTPAFAEEAETPSKSVQPASHRQRSGKIDQEVGAVSSKAGKNRRRQPGATFERGIVVAAHPEAARAGMQVLQAGGNAFDAGIAVEMALAVALPAAGNLGGGGFLLIHTPGDGTEFLDYREQAPLNLNRNRYVDSTGTPVGKNSLEGAAAAGIPGTLAGMEALHQRHGRLPWAQLLEPAVALARDGWQLTRREAGLLNKHRDDLIRINEGHSYLTRGSLLKPGDTLRNPELAQTLARLAAKGAGDFYRGETARILAEFMATQGADLTLADLQQYRAKWRAPLCGTYGEYRLCSAAPPSSGGFLLLQMLKLMEISGKSPGGLHSLNEIHLLAEAARRAYADRSEYLGDPDFHPVPLDALLDTAYLRTRTAGLTKRRATPSADVKPGLLIGNEDPDKIPAHSRPPAHEPTETTHYIVADDEGNVVTATTSLNGAYGCKRVVPRLGFLLNNTIDDFSLGAGLVNAYGLPGSTANALAAGKRMLSSMTPTLVYRNGKPELALGTPGGSTIPTTVIQVFLHHAFGGMSPADAVARPRLHHQWQPDYIRMEKGRLSFPKRMALRLRGHKIRIKGPVGRAGLVHIHPDGRMEGGADPRGDDCVAGY